MPKANAKTDATLSVPQPASKATRKSGRKGTSKGDANVAQSNATVDVDPQVLPQESNSRPKRSAASKGSKDNQPAREPQSVTTSRKRQVQANDQASNIPTTSTPETGLEQPPTKKLKTKSVKDSGIDSAPAPSASIKKGGTKKPKKAVSTDSGQPAKENIPPIPVPTASNSKKSNAKDRCEQQLNAVDHEVLEQRIKELEGKYSIRLAVRNGKMGQLLILFNSLAENANHRKAVERLERKAKRHDHRATQLATSTTDAKIDQLIDEPEAAKYSLQIEMGLTKDYKTYARIQRTVRDLARRTLDFNHSWKSQDPIVIGDLYRAAAEKEPFLRRFRQNWATGKLAQMYLRNSRSYHANIDIPESAVAVRRTKVTLKGADEAGLDRPDLSNKKKRTPRALIPAGSKLGKSTKSTTEGIPSSEEDEDDEGDGDDKDDKDDQEDDEDDDEAGEGIAGEDGEQEGEDEEVTEYRDDVDDDFPSSDGCGDE